MFRGWLQALLDGDGAARVGKPTAVLGDRVARYRIHARSVRRCDALDGARQRLASKTKDPSDERWGLLHASP